ncbi:hypothetical protein ALP50_05326 [Pseudomonas syringae pv. spinaceae]|nr:hypothetical protein ALP50_05326 [Pseudomonas syringae pv. spinaceae]
MAVTPTDWADPAWSGMAAKLVDLRELFDNLERAGSCEARNTKRRLYAFVSGLNFRQISNVVDAFHGALADIRAGLERDFPPEPSDCFTRWPGLLLGSDPITCSTTGLQIVELRCPADLDQALSGSLHRHIRLPCIFGQLPTLIHPI